jgi:tight adherence protein B
MWLLTALPLLGPGVGLLVGVEPGRLYGSEPARVGALAGLLLTLGGWAWARRILQRAHRPATTEGHAG